jgi:acylphosphatase
MVQGVAFRFTAERIAQGLDIDGWVRNLADGRVELLCEGDEKLLIEFLKKIQTGTLKQYIQDTDVSWSDATGEFKNFEIRFW